MLNDEYLIKFNEKYNYDNFNVDKKMYFIIGDPIIKVNSKKIAASCNLYKDEYGVLITNFEPFDNPMGDKLITHIENKDIFLLHRNIIKKSNMYSITICFVKIRKVTKEESKVINKIGKFNSIFEYLI